MNTELAFHSPSSRRKLRIFSTLVLALLGWSISAWMAARLLNVSAPLQRADAIVLLSGSSTLRERALYVSQLYAAGKAPLIIVTNDGQRGSWSNAEQRNPSYYEVTIMELVRLGVPKERIEVLMQPVSSTYEEAMLLRGHLKERPVTSILIVTSAYHSRRALWTFNRVFAGSNVLIGLESAPAGWQTPSAWTWWLRPRGWRSVPGEYLKLIHYWLRY
jgi:uncharacterized SAM-binding protein YcdF (DUF218 family)